MKKTGRILVLALLLTGCTAHAAAPIAGKAAPTLSLVKERMVQVNGDLYQDSGRESDIGLRCGMMDGAIDSAVPRGRIPKADGQSNFGTGFGFQYVDFNSIDVYFDGVWERFERVEVYGQDTLCQLPLAPENQ